MADESFAQKYNLVGLGSPARVSEKTRREVRGLYNRSNELISRGAEYSHHEERLFGGCPRPGEPGSEKFFTEL